MAEPVLSAMTLDELREKVAPLPWKLDGDHITDGGPNSIAVVAKGWNDDQDNALYLCHAANVLPALVAACKEINEFPGSAAAVARWEAALARADQVQ